MITRPRGPLVRCVAPVLLFGMGAIAAGCGEGSPPRTSDAEVRLVVSPLTLTGVGNAIYRLTVHNGATPPQVVWTRTIASKDFGDARGGAAYVGPCDASLGVERNIVGLEILALEDATGATIDPTSYDNPAPDGAPLERGFTCIENADVLVELNLVLVRDAVQGFFDVAVDFEDVFCSAKLDCADANGADLTLLHDPADPEAGRKTTVVMAFACTAGDGQTTWLHMSDLAVTCANGAYAISPARALEGNAGPAAPVFFQTSTYRESEDFPEVDKCFWNVALGVNEGPAAASCRLEATATASNTPFTSDAVPADTIYPVVRYAIALTDAQGQVQCGTNPLGAVGEHGSVLTRYSDFDGALDGAPVVVGHHWRCGADTMGDAQVRCAESATSFVSSTLGVRALFGNSATPYYQLQPGLTLGTRCCVNNCCSDAP